MNCAALGKSRVVAPFEVVDRGGKRIFVVDKNEVKVFNSGGRAVAVITADPEGGFFTASGGAGTVFFGVADPHTFPVTGLGITDNGVVRVTLGQNSDLGNFSLKFRGPSGRSVAAIGVSPDTNAGLALVNDAAGNRKAGIGVTKDGTGSVEVSSGNGRTIAQLTQGEHRGGKLLICSAASCDPPMVAAGDAGGYGVVATGPMYFNTGAGMLGAVPGSYIIGKK